MGGAGDLRSVSVRGCDYAVAAMARGGEMGMGYLIARGNIRLGILFYDVRSSPKETLNDILIVNLGFLMKNLPSTVL